MFRVISSFCFLLVLVLAYAAAQTNSTKSDADLLPDGPGQAVVQRDCLTCHSVHTTTSKRGNEDDWANTVSQMIGRGANVSDDDANTIVEYMAAHFGPSAPKPDSSKSDHAGPSQPAAPSSPPAANSPSQKPSGPVASSLNVNKAGIEELESSLGISKDEAENIVHYRQKNGDFDSIQQLLSVPGVDADKIKKDEGKIVF